MATHCFTGAAVAGVRQEGMTEGEFHTVGGVECYLATPAVDYPKEKAVIFLPDMFGIELVSGQLLCDDFARNGFQVVAIDLFNGDPAPMEVLEAGAFDFDAWLKRHGTDVTRPRINDVIATLRQQGIKEFAATGYCFSARYVFDLAFDGLIKVAAISHPSFLRIPEDFHKLKQTNVPLLINSCESDRMFPTSAQAQADAILGGGAMRTDLYRREYFEGCAHGFAIRGDMSKPKVKAGKEGAFRATVEFLWEHL